MKTGFKVMDAMTKKPITIDANATITECAQKMTQFDIGSLLVTENGCTVGIITENKIIRKIIAQQLSPQTEITKTHMSNNLISISPDTDIYDALVLMRDKQTRHLLVMHDEELFGFLTLKDILKIEPDLFDLIVERYQLREEEQKPVFGNLPGALAQQKTNTYLHICEGCGSYTEAAQEAFNMILCEECMENQMQDSDDSDMEYEEQLR